MNNMLFSLVRELRDHGVDAHLLMQSDELHHFHPSNDSFDLSYQEYTTEATWPKQFLEVPPERIARDLEGFDFLIVTGILLAFVERAGRVADVFFPHGSDLYKWPFFPETLRFDQRWRRRSPVAMFRALREGIRHATIVNQDDGNAFYREVLKRHGVLDRTTYFGTPMVYSPPFFGEAVAENRNRSAWYREFKGIRSRTDLMVMNHSRQQWGDAAGGISKGSDRLIRGVAELVHRRPDVRVALVLFEYGDHIRESRDLIETLGIRDAVRWFPLVSRKEILLGLLEADFGCGQFADGGIGGGTTWEVLSLGKPLLHSIDNANVNFSAFSGPYPVINVRQPTSFADVFEDFIESPDKYRKIGAAGRQWYEENFLGRSLGTYLELIRAKERGEDLLAIARRRAGGNREVVRGAQIEAQRWGG